LKFATDPKDQGEHESHLCGLLGGGDFFPGKIRSRVVIERGPGVAVSREGGGGGGGGFPAASEPLEAVEGGGEIAGLLGGFERVASAAWVAPQPRPGAPRRPCIVRTRPSLGVPRPVVSRHPRVRRSQITPSAHPRWYQRLVVPLSLLGIRQHTVRF